MKSKKLEKSRGIVSLAINTEETNYEKIAERTLKQASKVLNLPYKIITVNDLPSTTFTNSRYDIDLEKFVTWNNFGRHLIYDLSPFEETLVIDADYLVLSDNLLDIFQCSWDYLLHRKSHALTQVWPKTMGQRSLPYVWATVFAFRKTKKAELFFQLVDRIAKNYSYYRHLFNIEERNFRNDYAFAIADTILNGYTINNQSIPGSILAVDQSIKSLCISNNLIVAKDKSKSYILPYCDLHIMSKKYLQSEEFQVFLNELA